MYKQASRFQQHLRDVGIKPTGRKRGFKLGRRRRSNLARTLDDNAAHGALNHRLRYIENCRRSGVPPRVPPDVRDALIARGLLDD